jgi:hypothetical protein
MLSDIIQIAFLCIIMGCVSIPVSFTINSSPGVVWLGNALGSVLSALFVILVSERITGDRFKGRLSHTRAGQKIVKLFDEGSQNHEMVKARSFINKQGLRIFSLLSPIFPGVFISTVTVYLLGLDTKTYRRWMLAGVFFVSGAYVYGYWRVFVR